MNYREFKNYVQQAYQALVEIRESIRNPSLSGLEYALAGVPSSINSHNNNPHSQNQTNKSILFMKNGGRLAEHPITLRYGQASVSTSSMTI